MKQKTTHKILSLLLAVVLLFSLVPAVFAEGGGHITATKQTATEITQGQQYTLDLSQVFADSEGHTLSYAVTNDGGNQSTTKLKDGVYYFTSPVTGTYYPTITAQCESGSASLTLDITVKAGEVTDVKQYDYNETDANQVTVYVTISSDGVPILGKDKDGTVLSHLKVTVPYFDLALYDLQDFYRYATENGSGSYTGDTVIKRPTAMHLFIYMLERYYLGYPESECGTGAHKAKLFGACRKDEIQNMFGGTAYEAAMSPLEYTGGATSTYMQNFWGHDENLMYYRNHRYPLMSPGWGATADYILLSDGDAIDLAMFSNWGFYTHGAFCCTGAADSTEPVETLTVTQGETLRFTGLKYGTQSVTDGGVDEFVRVSEEDYITYVCFDQKWETTDSQPDMEMVNDEFTGGYVLDTADLAPGTYHLIGLDPNCETEDACYAPATCDLIVTASCEHTSTEYTFTDKHDGSFDYVKVCTDCKAEVESGNHLYGDVNNDEKVNSRDNTAIKKHLNGTKPIEDAIALYAADVNSDETVDMADTFIISGKSVGTVTDNLPIETTLKYTPNNDGTHIKAVMYGQTDLGNMDDAEACMDEDANGICDLCGGTIAAEADSNHDGFNDETGEYMGDAPTTTIPVKLIIPEGAEAKFYVGTTGEGQIVAAEDKGVDASNAQVHHYEITVPDGEYSCMVSDDSHNYGGVGFKVPLQTSIYEATNITLALTKFYTMTSSVKVNGTATPITIDSVDDFRVNLVAPGKAVIIPGENYLDDTIKAGTTYVVAPRMVWAYGNQILYNYTVDLNPELAATFGVSPQINQTFASTITAVQKKTFNVAALKTFTLTAPTAATTTFFYQINNFNDMVLEGSDHVKSVDNGDGTTTYTVYYPNFANASYRVEQEGYVVSAGYCKDNSSYTVTLREGDRTSTATNVDSKVGAGSNIEYENSVYLNVDDTKDTNELAMQTGETFRLRAFRAAWEIVNTVTANIMIEPDFHYAVLSGEDVVSVTPVTAQCTGNAKGNWMDIKALKEGTALIAVWYDAIDVSNSNTTLSGTYGATDPARYGYVLVNVGADKNVTWNPVSHDGDWDAEFDTVYYFGDHGTFTCAPDGVTAMTVQNLNGNTMGETVSVTAENGKYNVPVKAGSNLITVTTAEGKDYMLVRAKKIDYSIENATTGETVVNGAPVIHQGDNVVIHFDQFNMPVAKMSGIYNPGYMGTAKTFYTLNDKYSLSSVGTQYDYITDAKSCIKFTAYIAGENTLTGGYIQSGSMGDNFGNHRNIGDGGRGTNFSAVNVTGYFGSIEDIKFTVTENSAVQVNYDELVALKSVSIYGGTDNYNKGFSFTTKTDNNATNWTNAVPSSYNLGAIIVPTNYYNTMEMKWWYDGGEVHTVPLIANNEAIVPPSEFNADMNKILNIQILVTPADPKLGPTKVYSYLVYPGKTDLQYVHPVLKDLIVTDDSGNAIALNRAVNYNDTSYTLDVGAATSVNLTGKQLQKFTNKTNNKQDKADTVIVQRMNGSTPVGEAVEVYPLTGDRYPVGEWTLNNLDISGANALQIKVTSYVDGVTSRTYDIALKKAMLGDVTGDGMVDSQDATLVYAFANGKQAPDATQIAAADVNGDGAIDSQDATLVYAFANGKLLAFPCATKN